MLRNALRTALFLAPLLLWDLSSVEATDVSVDLEKIVTEAREEFGTPGISVAVVENDEIVWAEGYGLADVENEVPAKADTIYRIASISKPMAATALMQLVEQGRVDIDEPVQKYVPYFPEKPLTITLRHILTHTSGIRHYNPGEFNMKEHFDTLPDAIRIFKDDPLLFTPGTLFHYSSYAFNLIAGAIENASGLTFEAYMKEKIWEPAGMSDTRLEHQGPIVPHRARQYVKAGSNGRVRNAPYADLSVKWSGGGIISTVEDLARFHIALNTGKLLETATQAEMFKPYTLADGNVSNYGLGWRINKDDQGRTWIEHGGGATGGSSYLLRYPEGKLAVAIICNVEDAGDRQGLALRIAEAVMAAE